MMKIMILTAAAALMLAAGAQAQSSQYGAIENFYEANPDINTRPYASQAVTPSYWLTGWNQWSELDQRLINDGFILGSIPLECR
jgi:hypothetical protein